VRISGSEHVPPQPFLLDKMMEDFFIHYERQKRILHPILLAAEMHERLVTIHPFVDGNGRTSRLLMNFILLKNGYTLTILKGDPSSKANYFKSLEAVQVQNDPNQFYDLIVERVIASLEEHLEMV
jgi:Fic family protein